MGGQPKAGNVSLYCSWAANRGHWDCPLRWRTETDLRPIPPGTAHPHLWCGVGGMGVGDAEWAGGPSPMGNGDSSPAVALYQAAKPAVLEASEEQLWLSTALGFQHASFLWPPVVTKSWTSAPILVSIGSWIQTWPTAVVHACMTDTMTHVVARATEI